MRISGVNFLGEEWSVEASTEVQVIKCSFCKNPIQFINTATKPITKIRFRIGTAVMNFDMQRYFEELKGSEVCPYCGTPVKGKR